MVPWTTSPPNSILPFIAIFYFHDGKKEYQSRCVPSNSHSSGTTPNPFGIRRWPTPQRWLSYQHRFPHPKNPCHCRARPAKKDRMVPINPTIWFTWNPNDPCFDWRRPCFGGLLRQNRGQRGSRWLVVHCQNAKNLRLPKLHGWKKGVPSSFGLLLRIGKREGLEKIRKARWWFQIQMFFIFIHTWGRFPFCLIFFKEVETTNQKVTSEFSGTFVYLWASFGMQHWVCLQAACFLYLFCAFLDFSSELISVS